MAFKKAINSPIFSEISNYCSNNNIECYVVGGFVRDFILNRECIDVDILIEKLKLVIEYDGSYFHRNKYELDTRKTKDLQKNGYSVIVNQCREKLKL